MRDGIWCSKISCGQTASRSVLLSIIKNGNASTLTVVNGVKQVLNIAREAAPPGMVIKSCSTSRSSSLGAEGCAARRRDRRRADGADDPGLPRLVAIDARRDDLDPAGDSVLPGRPLLLGRNDEHDDIGPLKRFVDIGDHVKAGQLLAEITAPEIEDQIAQYQNSGSAAQATQHQNQAQRSLDQVTWGRDSVVGQTRLGDATAGRRRSLQLTGAAARNQCGSVQCRGDAGTTELFQPTEDLSEGRGAVRRGDHNVTSTSAA